ncbi:MAG: patatin family protein [Lachnospiraceae bacterium]|nr:patatin family protein [Lachnospiraceae bacterium]
MINASLILEGGGMKGIYTAGVLDFFLDKELEFSSVYGVSAGACTMASYISKQKGRGKDVMLDYLDDERYMGLKSLLKTGDIFNVDFNYRLVPEKLNPYDYEEFLRYQGKAYAVVTNIETGRAEYKRLKDIRNDISYIRASSSLPLVSRVVKIGEKKYLDGGIADSIPIKRSIKAGNVKNVVVMTKPVGYRRKPGKFNELIKARYVKYPKVYELMKRRYLKYNKTLDFLDELEKEGKVFVIRPQVDFEIGRLERNREKLLKLYEEGYKEAEERYEELMKYLNS